MTIDLKNDRLSRDRHLEDLIELLRLAYSGELAAAYAYRGHWRSVSNPQTREQIRQIEEDEWHHRELVGRMLERLGMRPSVAREIRAYVTGRVLGFLCHLSGWFAPMYGAGKLESRNIREYETAARLAAASERYEFVDCLLNMAEVEWDHESYFRSCVLSHRLSRRIRVWSAPPGRETIRGSFISDFPNETFPQNCYPAEFVYRERPALDGV